MSCKYDHKGGYFFLKYIIISYNPCTCGGQNIKMQMTKYFLEPLYKWEQKSPIPIQPTIYMNTIYYLTAFNLTLLFQETLVQEAEVAGNCCSFQELSPNSFILSPFITPFSGQ